MSPPGGSVCPLRVPKGDTNWAHPLPSSSHSPWLLRDGEEGKNPSGASEAQKVLLHLKRRFWHLQERVQSFWTH